MGIVISSLADVEAADAAHASRIAALEHTTGALQRALHRERVRWVQQSIAGTPGRAPAAGHREGEQGDGHRSRRQRMAAASSSPAPAPNGLAHRIASAAAVAHSRAPPRFATGERWTHHKMRLARAAFHHHAHGRQQPSYTCREGHVLMAVHGAAAASSASTSPRTAALRCGYCGDGVRAGGDEGLSPGGEASRGSTFSAADALAGAMDTRIGGGAVRATGEREPSPERAGSGAAVDGAAGAGEGGGASDLPCWYRCDLCGLAAICPDCAHLEPLRILPRHPAYARHKFVVFYRPGSDPEARAVRAFARVHRARIITPATKPKHAPGHPRPGHYFSRTSNCAVYRDRRLVTDDGVGVLLQNDPAMGSLIWTRPLTTGLFITKKRLVIVLLDGLQATADARARAAAAAACMADAAAALRDAGDTQHACVCEGDDERAKWLRCRVAAAGGRSLGTKSAIPALLVVQYEDGEGRTGQFWKPPPQVTRCKTLTSEGILAFVEAVKRKRVPPRKLTAPYFSHDMGVVRRERPGSPSRSTMLRCATCNERFDNEAEMRHHELSEAHEERVAARRAERAALLTNAAAPLSSSAWGLKAWLQWRAAAPGGNADSSNDSNNSSARTASWTTNPAGSIDAASARPAASWRITVPAVTLPSVHGLVPARVEGAVRALATTATSLAAPGGRGPPLPPLPSAPHAVAPSPTGAGNAAGSARGGDAPAAAASGGATGRPVGCLAGALPSILRLVHGSPRTRVAVALACLMLLLLATLRVRMRRALRGVLVRVRVW